MGSALNWQLLRFQTALIMRLTNMTATSRSMKFISLGDKAAVLNSKEICTRERMIL